MNQFRDTTKDFYKDLAAGRAEHKDFERFIYGQYGEKSYHKDDRDNADQRSYEERKRIENDFANYIEQEKAQRAIQERQWTTHPASEISATNQNHSEHQVYLIRATKII